MVAAAWRRCALLVFLSHTSALPLTVDAAARVLGVSPPLSRVTLRVAFRKRAAETHPDVVSGREAEFHSVRVAYERLSGCELWDATQGAPVEVHRAGWDVSQCQQRWREFWRATVALDGVEAALREHRAQLDALEQRHRRTSALLDEFAHGDAICSWAASTLDFLRTERADAERQLRSTRDGLQALMRQRDFMAQRARAAQAGASGPQQGEYGV